jgi:predicted RNase H-like HicB family nuclease
MKFSVTVNRDEDGVWVVECPSIPGCVSQGDTREISLENVKDAIRMCLDVRAEQGMSTSVQR